jgi:hypothetical protein
MSMDYFVHKYGIGAFEQNEVMSLVENAENGF